VTKLHTMERSSLCSKLKQQSISNSSRNMKQMYDFKVKGSSWDYGNEYNNNWGEGDLVAAGFSWPPRCYTCSFCKREFRSAQALGGHMNVHRRDRARLRQSPTRDGGNNNAGQFSLLNLNLDPNPSLISNPISSPSFFPSSPPPLSSLLTKFPQFTSTLPPLCPLHANATEMKRWGEDAVPVQNCRPITTDLIKMKASKGHFGVEKFNPSVHEKGCEVFKKPEFVRLDLEIGLLSQSKEELDLELRLGYT
ncbi:hypothetical protein Pfo_026381, partial [Paulownia fortunei]